MKTLCLALACLGLAAGCATNGNSAGSAWGGEGGSATGAATTGIWGQQVPETVSPSNRNDGTTGGNLGPGDITGSGAMGAPTGR